MPEQLKFDRNQFTQDMLGTLIGSNIRALSAFAANTSNSRELLGDAGYKSREQLDQGIQWYKDHSPKDMKEIRIAQYLYECYSNPNSEIAQEIRQYWNFAGCMFEQYDDRYTNNYKILINKLDVFDEQTQLWILKYLGSKIPDNTDTNHQMQKMIKIKIANNKSASVDDKLHISSTMARIDHDFIRDFIEELKQNLDKELHSDFPNTEEIKRTCNNVHGIMGDVRSSLKSGETIKNPLNQQYIDTVLDEFNIEKISKADAEYIPQINQSLEERLSVAEQKTKSAQNETEQYKRQSEQNDAVISRMQQEFEGLRQQYDAEKAKNKQLTGELNSLQDTVKKQESFIKRIKMKIGGLKTGLLAGNGVKELQQYINDNDISR